MWLKQPVRKNFENTNDCMRWMRWLFTAHADKLETFTPDTTDDFFYQAVVEGPERLLDVVKPKGTKYGCGSYSLSCYRKLLLAIWRP
jgi:hypothetical protein